MDSKLCFTQRGARQSQGAVGTQADIVKQCPPKQIYSEVKNQCYSWINVQIIGLTLQLSGLTSDLSASALQI